MKSNLTISIILIIISILILFLIFLSLSKLKINKSKLFGSNIIYTGNITGYDIDGNKLFDFNEIIDNTNSLHEFYSTHYEQFNYETTILIFKVLLNKPNLGNIALLIDKASGQNPGMENIELPNNINNNIILKLNAGKLINKLIIRHTNGLKKIDFNYNADADYYGNLIKVKYIVTTDAPEICMIKYNEQSYYE